MCRFIESIKIENQKIFLGTYHQRRVNATFASFSTEKPLDLQEIFDHTLPEDDALYKLRIVYDLEKNFETELIPYSRRAIKTFELMENNTLNYALKSEDRTSFSEMKIKAQAEEIIIVKEDHITDSSYSNLVFLKDKKWFTPSSFLLNGVQRQFLLDSQKIEEVEITLQNIRTFSHFQMINALNPLDNTLVYPLNLIQNLP